VKDKTLNQSTKKESLKHVLPLPNLSLSFKNYMKRANAKEFYLLLYSIAHRTLLLSALNMCVCFNT